MPRETVRINLSSRFPIEVGARFFSVLAYPNPADLAERKQFCWAICRLYLLKRVQDDPEFGSRPYLIVPAIYATSHYEFIRTFKKGNKKLLHSLIAARWIAMPHLRDDKSRPVQIEKDGEAIVPTVKNMSIVAMEELGWKGKGKSLPTFKSRIWGPSRPIVHAAAAYLLWCHYAERILPAEEQDDSFLFLSCVEQPHSIAAIIKKSENFRLMLPSIERFSIQEDETIQFLTEGTPVEVGATKTAASKISM
jgi:hypothetical protein